jgi:hypothetical protein
MYNHAVSSGVYTFHPMGTDGNQPPAVIPAAGAGAAVATAPPFHADGYEIVVRPDPSAPTSLLEPRHGVESDVEMLRMGIIRSLQHCLERTESELGGASSLISNPMLSRGRNALLGLAIERIHHARSVVEMRDVLSSLYASNASLYDAYRGVFDGPGALHDFLERFLSHGIAVFAPWLPTSLEMRQAARHAPPTLPLELTAMGDAPIWPVQASGPVGNVPRVSVPDCFDFKWAFQQEWWYCIGQFCTSDGKQYGLQTTTLRANIEGVQGTGLFFGLATSPDNTYLWQASVGLGASNNPSDGSALHVLPVGDTQFDVSFASNVPLQPRLTYRMQYVGGAPVGMAGSRYRLTVASSDAALSLDLADERGTVLEGINGYMGAAPGLRGAGSYEMAQPRLAVVGGSITQAGTTTAITSGMIWHDRQFLTNPPTGDAHSMHAEALPTTEKIHATLQRGLSQGRRMRADPSGKTACDGKPPELYCGSWIGAVLNNGVSFYTATMWQPATTGKQWITGSEVGLPPVSRVGAVYMPVTSTEQINGQVLLGNEGYDLNILNPKDPETSPHWTSDFSGITYCTGYVLTFKHPIPGVPETLYIVPLVNASENRPPLGMGCYLEAVSAIYETPDFSKPPVGYCALEEMGYN